MNEEKLADFVKCEVTIHIDLGFQGLQKEFINIKILKKKPKGKELTEQEKQLNREKSSVRELWEPLRGKEIQPSESILQFAH